MSPQEFNQDEEFQDAIDLLIERYGLEAAERRVCGALGEIRRRMAEEGT